MKKAPTEISIPISDQLFRGDKRLRIALIGKPNSGKSTLFKAVSATSIHTGSLAGGDRAATSLMAHCGVIRCNTVQQLFDIALGFCNQPLPPGDGLDPVQGVRGVEDHLTGRESQKLQYHQALDVPAFAVGLLRLERSPSLDLRQHYLSDQKFHTCF